MPPDREVTARQHIDNTSEDTPSAAVSRRSCNWVHPVLVEGVTPSCGKGIVASQDVSQGTLLMVYGGRVMTLEEFEALSDSMQHFPYQVEENLFLGPRDENELGVGERLNHSCSPNAGFQGAIHVVAIRDVRAGESITIDYATCVSADHDAFVMVCKCGEKNCRGVITGEDWKRQEIQARLLPYFQPYLRRKIQRSRSVDNDDQPTQFPSTSASNDDSRSKEPIVARVWGTCSRLAKAVVFFCKSAFKQDWGAIVVSCLAALPSNLLTCVLVVWGAEWLASKPLFSSQAAYVSAVSLLTGFVGYATYLLMYYVGMVYKERSDLWIDGRLSPYQMRLKLRVIVCDFVMHLPSDFFVLPLMGAGQGGLYVLGLSQFWSIFWAQAIADMAYAVKEPLFWHGAKKVARSWDASSVQPLTRSAEFRSVR